MPFPPSPRGHGGSQRAWYFLNALVQLAPVHFVLVYPPTYSEAAHADLRALETLVESITRIAVSEWSASWHIHPRLPKRIGRWLDLMRMGSGYAPRLSRGALLKIARQLPTSRPDLIFAGRLPAAVIAESLIERGLLSCSAKVVDFDDVQSRFQQREADAERRGLSPDKALMNRLLLKSTRAAEHRIAATWNAVSVCSDEDVSFVANEQPLARVFKVPNVVDKPQLPYQRQERFTVLFVGNLSFGPNVHGLQKFVQDAWPVLRVRLPNIRMQVVGLNPGAALRALMKTATIELEANVPSVEPYYAQADVVIAPILFGGGTRVKILEAMAFGRAIVSTTIGAEGLHARDGQELLIADTMHDFAAAIIRLASDPELLQRLVRNGRALQQELFGPPAINSAVRTMLAGSCASVVGAQA